MEKSVFSCSDNHSHSVYMYRDIPKGFRMAAQWIFQMLCSPSIGQAQTSHGRSIQSVYFGKNLQCHNLTKLQYKQTSNNQDFTKVRVLKHDQHNVVKCSINLKLKVGLFPRYQYRKSLRSELNAGISIGKIVSLSNTTQFSYQKWDLTYPVSINIIIQLYF